MGEWISVKDRLPSEEEYRNIKNKYHDMDTRELIPLLVCIEYTDLPFRALYDGKNWGDGVSKLNVLYWMPLPEPPKEVQSE